MRQRAGRHQPQLGNFLERLLVAHGIFDEERLVLFDQPAAAKRVGKIELLVEVDHPVTLADTFTDFLARRGNQPHTLMRVEDVIGDRTADRGVHTKTPISCLHRGSRALTERRACIPSAAAASARLRLGSSRRRASSSRRRAGRPERRRIALDMVARGPVKQLVHRQLQRLAFDVPQRDIERALPMDLFAARRIEPVHVHVLPDLLDLERILADQAAGKILNQVWSNRPRRCR